MVTFEACSPAEKREHLRRHRSRGISVSRGCELMGLTRSTFYDAPPAALPDDGILARIGTILRRIRVLRLPTVWSGVA